MLWQIVRLNSHPARNKELKIFIEIDDGLPTTAIGGSVSLVQILSNLLSNTIKSTEESDVKLALRVISDHQNEFMVSFKVEDAGIGVFKEKSAYIFKAFTQASSDTTRKSGDKGLGQATVKA